MGSAKRLIVASISGLLFGFVCFAFASSGPEPVAWPVALQIIVSRTLIGVAIGLSRFRFGHWSIHGLVIGLVFSLPLAFSGYMAPESADFSKDSMFVWTVLLGAIYGLLIEVITSVFFKAKLERSTVA